MFILQTLCSKINSWGSSSCSSSGDWNTLSFFYSKLWAHASVVLGTRGLLVLVFDQHSLSNHCRGLVHYSMGKLHVYPNLQYHLSKQLHFESITQFLLLPFKVISLAKTSTDHLGTLGCSLLGPRTHLYHMYLSYLHYYYIVMILSWQQNLWTILSKVILGCCWSRHKAQETKVKLCLIQRLSHIFI